MVESTVKGIVISSLDYKENDKILTIYTLEQGTVYAKLVGVKKPKAKLKAAKSLFCFAEFDLVSKNGDFSTVKSANIIDSFYQISQDLERFYSGCTILEVLKTVGRENQKNELLFLDTLKALQSLVYSKANAKIIEIKFLVKIFEAMGYTLSLNKCNSCGEEFRQKRFFSASDGAIVCSACKTNESVEISALTHSAMRLSSECPYEKLETLKLSDISLLKAIDLLKENFQARFDYKLKNINL